MAKEDKSNAALQQLLDDISTRSPSENKSGKTVSDASAGEKAMVEKVNKMSPSEFAAYMRKMKAMAGEENKPDGDGYRNGGSVNISNFKGNF